MSTNEFYISYKIIRDYLTLHGASPNTPLSQILNHVLKQNPDTSTGTKPSEYKILVAHQVTDPGVQTLKDLDISEGDYLFFYRPQLASMRLHLIPPKALQSICPDYVFETTEVLIGRRDETTPDLDLTPLVKDPLKISRKAAWLRAENERWTIEKHPEGHSAIYVDQVLLEPGKIMELNDTTVIDFGKNPQEPDLTLRVKLDPIQ